VPRARQCCSVDPCGSSPEVGALPSNHFAQYLFFSILEVGSEKLLSVSATADHIVQLLLIKSCLAPSCPVGESSVSILVYIVTRHGPLSSMLAWFRWASLAHSAHQSGLPAPQET
jgi:hypothetical protein